jgi:hypothetical protein
MIGPADADPVAMMHSRPVKPGSALPPALQTIVAGGNVADVSSDIQSWHDTQHPDCKFVKVLSASVIEQEQRFVTEHWTIEACKQQSFTYKVWLMPDPKVLVDAVLNLDTPH